MFAVYDIEIKKSKIHQAAFSNEIAFSVGVYISSGDLLPSELYFSSLQVYSVRYRSR